jgi:hypothetical protein
MSMSALTFDELSILANSAHAELFPGFWLSDDPSGVGLSLAATVGKVCEQISVLDRRNLESELQEVEFLDEISRSIADVQITLQVLAAEVGIYLGQAVKARFYELGLYPND